MELGIETIADVNSHSLDYRSPSWRCHYILGQRFLVSLFQTLGEEAMSAALREIYLRRAHDGLDGTEVVIYRTFLSHTPPGLEGEFRALYRRLHGGPFLDAEK